MLSRINVFLIIRDHFATLYEYRTGNQKQPFAWSAFIGFFVFPLLIGIFLYWLRISLSSEIRNGLLTALTLLAGLMLNLLAIAYSMIKNNNRGDTKKVFYDTLEDTCSNISYSVLISLLSIIFLLLPPPTTAANLNIWLQRAVDFYAAFIQAGLYFLLINNVLTLFMILRRMHILMMDEIKVSR